MRRTRLSLAAGGLAAAGVVTVAVLATSSPECVDVPEFNVRVCAATTTTPATTSTTTAASTTVPDQTTSSAPARSLVIAEDTVLTDQVLVLRAGDSLEFRNGARLSVGEGASVDWQGSATSTWSEGGAVQNLVRDINIFGEGDIRFEAGSLPSTIRYVNIDLQPLDEVGRYPLHWHLVGDGSRGTLVEGVVVANSTNRAFVPHGSNGITFRETIASNIHRQAYWWDLPGSNEVCGSGTSKRICDGVDNSSDILFDRVLSDGAYLNPGEPGFHTQAAFVLGAGAGNIIRDSAAVNTRGGVNCSGFQWPEFTRNTSRDQPTVWVFEDNYAAAHDCAGIFVWQNDAARHLVDGFTGGGIIHGAYINNYLYQDVDVPFFEVHALGWAGVDGGSIGTVRVLKHSLAGDPVEFRNVLIDQVVVNNAANGGRIPGTYMFTNTGLTCADVSYVSVVAGSKVIIDGTEC